jgi:hypothetical protein
VPQKSISRSHIRFKAAQFQTLHHPPDLTGRVVVVDQMFEIQWP